LPEEKAGTACAASTSPDRCPIDYYDGIESGRSTSRTRNNTPGNHSRTFRKGRSEAVAFYAKAEFIGKWVEEALRE
jgi:hypothetical protein